MRKLAFLLAGLLLALAAHARDGALEDPTGERGRTMNLENTGKDGNRVFFAEDRVRRH